MTVYTEELEDLRGMNLMIGYGSHARDMIETIPPASRGWCVVYHHRSLRRVPRGAEHVYIGVNAPQLRAQIAAELDCHDDAWVHPDASTYGDYSIGHGTHVNVGVVMGRCKVGDHCTIAPSATILGDVTIGDRVYIGAGAVIGNLSTIGDDVTIGMCAAILPETKVPDGETWVGVPARKVTT